MPRSLWAALALAAVALVSSWLRLPQPMVFAVCAAALLPLSAVIGRPTEDLADHMGPRFGGLLNATFGNAAKLTITLFALKAGLVTLVKASNTARSPAKPCSSWAWRRWWVAGGTGCRRSMPAKQGVIVR
jgi:Ca2+/H+ antiporter